MIPDSTRREEPKRKRRALVPSGVGWTVRKAGKFPNVCVYVATKQPGKVNIAAALHGERITMVTLNRRETRRLAMALLSFAERTVVAATEGAK